MPTAKKVGGQWSVLVYLGRDENNKKMYKRVSGRNKKNVEKDAAILAIEAKLAPSSHSPKVGEILDRYIEIKNNVLSPSTIKGYTSLRHHHFTEIEEIEIDDLTQSDIQQLINSRALTLSSKTVHNIYGLLMAAIKEFYPGNYYRVQLPARTKPEIKIPDSDVIKQYLQLTQGKELHTAITMAAFLGLRRSEICALQQNDIDFKHKTIRINKAVVVDDSRRTIVKHPKSYAGNRTIIMPDIVCDELKSIKTPFIVNLTLFQVTHQFHRLNEILGYNFRFHDLRHYNASVMLLLNVPDKYAQERIGHATNSMLKDVYQHTFDSKHIEVADTINSFFIQEFSS